MEHPFILKNNTAQILSECTTILPEGFRIDLTVNTQAWYNAVRSYGSRPLCDAAALWLTEAYRQAYSQPFLFSESCISFELQYHLNAYLYTQGLGRIRHITTVPIPKRLLERACRSVEIDTSDVWRWSQRLMFRYYFGIRNNWKRTEKDPFCRKIFGSYRRIPFLPKGLSSSR